MEHQAVRDWYPKDKHSGIDCVLSRQIEPAVNHESQGLIVYVQSVRDQDLRVI